MTTDHYNRLREIRACQECGDPVKGRADKKFCSDQCRVSFNNRLNCDETNYMRNVNNVLRKNRRILSGLNQNGNTRVSAANLRQKGFDFEHFTNTDQTNDGAICYYCYEQGYMQIEKEHYSLVTKRDIIT